MKIDLHVHSSYSDGVMSPEELVDLALDIELSAIAITDHDNMLSYDIAKAYAEKKAQETGKPALELIPGVEINTIWNNHEIHILGYYMNKDSKPFQDLLNYQQHARAEQTMKIVEKLNEKNINVKFEHIKSQVLEGGSIGRPHIAKAITNIGGTKTVMEAYNKYINDSASTYVKRITVSPHEAVETIYEAQGIPVIAHPCDLEFADSLIEDLMHYGLRGVEAYHRKHSPAMVEYYSSLAEKYGLIVTGGSDFHAPNQNNQIVLGKTLVPAWVLDNLKKEKSRIEIASAN